MGAKLVGWLCAVVVSAGAGAAWATPVTIEFEGAALGNFVGPAVEDGFSYSLLAGSGGLFVSSAPQGNPGQVMDGNADVDGGGVLRVVSTTGGELFNFLGMDLAEFDDLVIAGNNDITIEGFLLGASVGTEVFSPVQSPGGVGPYSTVVAGGALLGANIDELRFTLPAVDTPSGSALARLDNVVLDKMVVVSDAGVPEPVTGGLGVMGLGALGAATRRRRGR